MDWSLTPLHMTAVSLLIGDYLFLGFGGINVCPGKDRLALVDLAGSTLVFQQYGSVQRCILEIETESRVYYMDWNWFDNMFDNLCDVIFSYFSIFSGFFIFVWDPGIVLIGNFYQSGVVGYLMLLEGKQSQEGRTIVSPIF